jgi:hypothetical protein
VERGWRAAQRNGTMPHLKGSKVTALSLSFQEAVELEDLLLEMVTSSRHNRKAVLRQKKNKNKL